MAACRDFIDAYVGTDCSLRRATNVYCRERCLRASSSGRRLCSACGFLTHWPDPVGIDQTTQPTENYAAEPQAALIFVVGAQAKTHTACGWAWSSLSRNHGIFDGANATGNDWVRL